MGRPRGGFAGGSLALFFIDSPVDPRPLKEGLKPQLVYSNSIVMPLPMTSRPIAGSRGNLILDCMQYQVDHDVCFCSAELVMDFHAHLDKHEVIGLLAGTWDPATKVVRVERAFPVRESLGAAATAGGTAGGGGAAAAGAAKDEGGARGGAGGSSSGNGSGNDHINVEMDSEDQFKVTEVIQQQYGLQVVGWYHSHPTFTPLPSLIDLGNQLMMQRNAGEEGTPGGEEPYIAAILSPYDSRLPSLQSAVTWFNVAYDKSKVSLDKDLLEQVGGEPSGMG